MNERSPAELSLIRPETPIIAMDLRAIELEMLEAADTTRSISVPSELLARLRNMQESPLGHDIHDVPDAQEDSPTLAMEAQWPLLDAADLDPPMLDSSALESDELEAAAEDATWNGRIDEDCRTSRLSSPSLSSEIHGEGSGVWNRDVALGLATTQDVRALMTSAATAPAAFASGRSTLPPRPPLVQLVMVFLLGVFVTMGLGLAAHRFVEQWSRSAVWSASGPREASEGR